MKKLLIILSVIIGVIGLSGCVEEAYGDPTYPAPSGHYVYGSVEYCDVDGNCRYVNDVYYYYGGAGEVFYYDTVWGCWIGPRGWFNGGVWVHGWPVGFREHYRPFFHWRGGYRGWHGGYHGGWHGGGGGWHHGGGGGGHRR